MQKTNLVFTAVLVVFLGFYAYTVFLSDNALINRTEITKDGNGGYTAVTERTDGAKIIEVYEVDANGTPLSHSLDFVDSVPGSQPRAIKKGTFEPKFK